MRCSWFIVVTTATTGASRRNEAIAFVCFDNHVLALRSWCRADVI